MLDLLYREDWRDYFKEINNIPDYSQFVAHSIFFCLKLHVH